MNHMLQLNELVYFLVLLNRDSSASHVVDFALFAGNYAGFPVCYTIIPSLELIALAKVGRH